MTVFVTDYPPHTDHSATNRRIVALFAGATLAVLLGSIAAACSHQPARAARGVLPVDESCRVQTSCADVMRCNHDVACTEMSMDQAKREGIIQ